METRKALQENVVYVVAKRHHPCYKLFVAGMNLLFIKYLLSEAILILSRKNKAYLLPLLLDPYWADSSYLR